MVFVYIRSQILAKMRRLHRNFKDVTVSPIYLMNKINSFSDLRVSEIPDVNPRGFTDLSEEKPFSKLYKDSVPSVTV